VPDVQTLLRFSCTCHIPSSVPSSYRILGNYTQYEHQLCHSTVFRLRVLYW